MRGWRLLLVHDTTSTTCDHVLASIEAALGNVEVVEASSVEGALASLGAGSDFDVSFVCLDLPPAPTGGIRLAQHLVADRRPVVFVTRSLRWLPRDAIALRDVPWVTPDATAGDVSRAIGAAIELAMKSRANAAGGGEISDPPLAERRSRIRG